MNLYKFAQIEAGVEAMGREPLVGSDEVIDKLMQEYECNCVNYPSKAGIRVKVQRW